MNSSQSSDVFADNIDLSLSIEMDTVSYDTLVSNVKAALSRGIEKESEKKRFPYHFTKLLDDCFECVTQSLDIIINKLCVPNIEITKVTQYLMDSVTILQMLSAYIKNVMGSISMSCCNMKLFPATTGRIIMMVYTHCKDSESLYGATLSRVEMQLKEMFRTCHELQITYLMIIEKYFIFDLTVEEELDVLIEALDINLKIGEIVQTLDVKTMAEQWKAYTAICEKYASCLKRRNIYYKCTKVLCIMVENSIKSAIENDQEEKIVLRSFKVTNFTVKILLRICSIFRSAPVDSFDHILELLIHIYANCSFHQNTTTCEKSSQHIHLFYTNIKNPTDCLVKELFFDEHFINCMLNYDIRTLALNNKLPGYIYIIVALIKSIVESNDDQTLNVSKNKIIKCIYSFLPYGHIWFNTGFKLHADSSHGLYEHLLIHALALSSTMDLEEYNALENTMIEAILSTESCGALFSTNLWELLTRKSGQELLFVQLTSLCSIYRIMASNQLFHDSPQAVHLSHAISRLFHLLPDEDKLQVFKRFHINDNRNVSLWSAIKIKNLPEDIRHNAEEEVAERLKMQLLNLTSDGCTIEKVGTLGETMGLAATCSFSIDHGVTDCLMKAWEKTCPGSNKLVVPAPLSQGTLWHLHYIESMVAMTCALEKWLHQKPAAFLKILHVISEITATNNIEMKLLLTPLLFKVALWDAYDENKNVAESLLIKSFKHLFEDRSSVIRNNLYSKLRDYICNNNIKKIISKVSEDVPLEEAWKHFREQGTLKQDDLRNDFEYQHKCIKLNDNNSNRNNFYLADINTLFENESESESEQPASKKLKFNDNEADAIIARLENDASSLCKLKDNIFTSEHINKVRNVCELLQNAIQ